MPNSLQSLNNTNSSNKPNNAEFMEVVFPHVPEDTKQLVVSFNGNPYDVDTKYWFAKIWGKNTKLQPSRNNYFALSVYAKDEEGKHRRTKAAFRGLYAIMLDDIGTKVGQSIEELPLPPSWVLETSEGNYQVGYLLSQPLIDVDKADALLNGFIDAGLCDKGASGPTARLARLPVGVNGKHAPAFVCDIKVWSPEYRYTPEELVGAFALDLTSTVKPKTAKKKSLPRDEIFQPAPTDNPVIEALKAKKLYKRDLSGGKHDITCPWVHEHTEGVDDGAAYLEPTDNYPIGGFKCHHSHGGERSIHDLLEFLGVPLTAARMRPNIRAVRGQLHQVVHYAEHVLADTGKYFQNGAGIVTLVRDGGTNEYRLRFLPSPALTTALSACASWERYDARAKDYIAIDPPEKVVTSLAAATHYQHLPYLLGIAHQPYISQKGEVVIQRGYNEESKLYGAFDGQEYNIPEEPTKADAEQALLRLSSLLEEFPFATEYDRSAALSAMLTGVLRSSLSLAPMYHVQAPQIGSGKTYLCQLIGAMASSKKPNPTSFPHTNEECQKVLLAELMQSPSVIEFDNLTTDLLPHKSLCTVLTSEVFMGRILGVSKTAEVSTRTLFLSSGNNVVPVGDMARRCVTILLNPQDETPMSRTFKRPNLIEEVYATRTNYVSDALTIVRAWICAGRPHTECRNVGSYGEWSELCRQPLLWLGMEDPAQAIFEGMESDPDKELLKRFLTCWYEAFGKKPTMLRKAVLIAEDEEFGDIDSKAELYEVFQDIAGERGGINRQRLGWWLKRHANRIVDNLRIVKAEGTRAAVAWQIELVG